MALWMACLAAVPKQQQHLDDHLITISKQALSKMMSSKILSDKHMSVTCEAAPPSTEFRLCSHMSSALTLQTA